MTENRSRSRRVLGVSLILVAIVLCFFTPFLWIVSNSFKPQLTIFADVTPLSWKTFLPVHPVLENYRTLFARTNILHALLNTAIVSAAQVALTLVLCSMAAYALTRIRFRGSKVVFALILLTFLLPVEAMLVPLYQVVSGLGLDNTLLGVMIPWIASPFGLFLLKQSFEELPRDLEDAARIDGAGHLRTFVSVILPNVKVPLLTLGLVTFLFSWNSFLWPLVIAQAPEIQLIQVAIAQQGSPTQLPNWGETFAGATVATLPLILLFLLLQKYFTQGMAMSGIKG
ncbi:carbohydrate ABC transporter permease [Pseudooceanicola sp. CBS1P-1]|uniref:sn-glycerol-3-phosphate transport system permease protein UgpE n=1 Tax=Pseudooceanicola albus TaxID=2692189 RepID=A0A6L7G4K7_9RHOB|nr:MULTISPECIES: carbohydrate ABC transporter permease [Pseudooceanicola]MBT9385076.1 carbohydrate ABC transporter permease [Pseudooceanicola endophyticus]MXN18632.1 ABC transporter permease subunit [Pseudooceanicola albus]